MINITKEQINEIADQLEFGMKCFLHRETGEIVFYPDELRGWDLVKNYGRKL